MGAKDLGCSRRALGCDGMSESCDRRAWPRPRNRYCQWTFSYSLPMLGDVPGRTRQSRKTFTQVCFSVVKPSERYESQEPRPILAEGLFTMSVVLHTAVPKGKSEPSCRPDRTQSPPAAAPPRGQPAAPDKEGTGYPLKSDGSGLDAPLEQRYLIHPKLLRRARTKIP